MLANSGGTFERSETNTANTAASSMPGMTPDMNSAPIDCSVMTPNTIIGMLGGMRMPSVPPAATIAPENSGR